MKQTAVEYLYINLLLPLGDEEIKVFNKAIEMEKEQIIDAYNQGVNDIYNHISSNAKLYYNETFKLKQNEK